MHLARTGEWPALAILFSLESLTSEVPYVSHQGLWCTCHGMCWGLTYPGHKSQFCGDESGSLYLWPHWCFHWELPDISPKTLGSAFSYAFATKDGLWLGIFGIVALTHEGDHSRVLELGTEKPQSSVVVLWCWQECSFSTMVIFFFQFWLDDLIDRHTQNGYVQ